MKRALLRLDELPSRLAARARDDHHHGALSEHLPDALGEPGGARHEPLAGPSPIRIVEHLDDEAVLPGTLPGAPSPEHGRSHESLTHAPGKRALQRRRADLRGKAALPVGAMAGAGNSGPNVQLHRAGGPDVVSSKAKSLREPDAHAKKLPGGRASGKKLLQDKKGRKLRAGWVYLEYDAESDSFVVETSWLPAGSHPVCQKLAGFERSPDGGRIRIFKPASKTDDLAIRRAVQSAAMAVLAEIEE